MVLSAVYRTDQIFGAAHIVSVLRGERTEGVLRHKHDRLRTFGVGAAHAATYWRGLVRQLIALRALDVDTEGHGGLFLVQEEARPILRGEVRVMLRQDRPGPVRAERPERGRVAAVVPAGGGALDRSAGRRRYARCTRRCGFGGWRRRRGSRSRRTSFSMTRCCGTSPRCGPQMLG